MHILIIYITAFTAAVLQHRNELRRPQYILTLQNDIKGFLEWVFGFCFGSKAIQLFGNAHNLSNGADVIAPPPFRVAAAVVALHVLQAALPLHLPRDIVGISIIRSAGTFLLCPQPALLKGGDERAAVSGVLPVNGGFFLGKIVAPDLVFGRDKRLAKLMVHAALVSKIGVLAVDLLASLFCVRRKTVLTSLGENHLRIGSNPN